MDIEAKRNRNKARGMIDFEKWSLGMIADSWEDCRDLLNYISALESEKKQLEEKLRFKKTEKQLPPVSEIVLLKKGKCYYTGFRTVKHLGDTEEVWSTAGGFYNLNDFPEWREIE